MDQLDDFNSKELFDLFQAARLAARYKDGSLSEREGMVLREWLNKSPTHRTWFEDIIREDALRPQLETFKNLSVDSVTAFEGVRTKIGIEAGQPGIVRMRAMVISVAASVLLALAGFAVYKYLPGHLHRVEDNAAVSKNISHDVLPGGYHALLTLADGSEIALDSAGKNKTIARQGASIVESTASGDLAYRAGETHEKEIFYNTLTTRRGDTYKVVLPDGSGVWLNSSSSLHYPTRFVGKSREVTLDGEGYFEIKSNPNQPFIVHTTNEDVHVIGTHFDISAYSDDAAITTSLLEGSILVTAGSDQRLLKEPSQAQLGTTGGLHLVGQANLDAAIAWKNGIFDFEHVPISLIMRQLSRWYDIQVEYQGIAPDVRFSANIIKSTPISAVLNLLSETRGISFDVQGNKVIVKKYSSKTK